jgi:ABC-type antimicrobial peptide transport system permease subunit
VSGVGWIALAGIATGVLAATAVARALRTQLLGVALFDPAVYIVSAALLVLVVVVASLIPARTATRVNPVAALKGE